MERFCTVDLDRISKVSEVKRGIYVMQLTEGSQFIYRFGAVGINGKNNNALRRLGQIDEGKTKWRYFSLISFLNEFPCKNIKMLENDLRAKFRQTGGLSFIQNKDRFEVVGVDNQKEAEEKVEVVFNEFWQDIASGV